MSENTNHDPATHLGRQMKRDRTAHGWTMREMFARTGVHIGTLSATENGIRPMTERLAVKCDEVFPERHGWYVQYYQESKSWIPAGFRSWAEYEERARSVRSWTPSFIDGLLQTEEYARAQLSTATGATGEIIAKRLAGRMARQKRVLFRPDPPDASFVIDQMALYRCVGSPQVMAAQLDYLSVLGRFPNITLQVIPAVAHPAGASSFMLGDDAAYAEHVVGGYVFTEDQRCTEMSRLFNTIRSESMKASESLALIEWLGEIWATGVSPLTQTPTADSASK